MITRRAPSRHRRDATVYGSTTTAMHDNENTAPPPDERVTYGVYYGQAPTRQLHSIPIAVSGSGRAGKQVKSFDAVIHMQESAHKVPQSASQAALSRMQLTLHATRRTPRGASRLMQPISAWSVKTRRAPSRRRRDARVYG